MEMQGSSHCSSLNGGKFELKYNALPKPLASLEIGVDNFAGYEELHQEIELKKEMNNPFVLLGDKH
ncbi:hypothetical protein [Cytobacillus purgationiresistens]|uniref:Uncharacterized protein n=1 Tax=Cytobacillus purgationiresistens TaxID=863449 RepID=A0ABU0ANS9_9BACI|nr:hypothetical protein [Cytobacillus purgationiresistens]MDQ0272058.1 hypothetical protein [Cytobacillus purgationiresistens]